MPDRFVSGEVTGAYSPYTTGEATTQIIRISNTVSEISDKMAEIERCNNSLLDHNAQIAMEISNTQEKIRETKMNLSDLFNTISQIDYYTRNNIAQTNRLFYLLGTFLLSPIGRLLNFIFNIYTLTIFQMDATTMGIHNTPKLYWYGYIKFITPELRNFNRNIENGNYIRNMVKNNSKEVKNIMKKKHLHFDNLIPVINVPCYIDTDTTVE